MRRRVQSPDVSDNIAKYLGVSVPPKGLVVAPFVVPVMEHPFEEASMFVNYVGAITQNQWYDLLSGAECVAGGGIVWHNVRVITLMFDQATANEDIELRIIAMVLILL